MASCTSGMGISNVLKTLDFCQLVLRQTLPGAVGNFNHFFDLTTCIEFDNKVRRLRTKMNMTWIFGIDLTVSKPGFEIRKSELIYIFVHSLVCTYPDKKAYPEQGLHLHCMGTTCRCQRGCFVTGSGWRNCGPTPAKNTSREYPQLG